MEIKRREQLIPSESSKKIMEEKTGLLSWLSPKLPSECRSSYLLSALTALMHTSPAQQTSLEVLFILPSIFLSFHSPCLSPQS